MTLHLKLPHQRSHLLYLHIGHPDVMTIGGSFLGNSGTIITFDEVDSRSGSCGTQPTLLPNLLLELQSADSTADYPA